MTFRDFSMNGRVSFHAQESPMGEEDLRISDEPRENKDITEVRGRYSDYDIPTRGERHHAQHNGALPSHPYNNNTGNHYMQMESNTGISANQNQHRQVTSSKRQGSQSELANQELELILLANQLHRCVAPLADQESSSIDSMLELLESQYACMFSSEANLIEAEDGVLLNTDSKGVDCYENMYFNYY